MPPKKKRKTATPRKEKKEKKVPEEKLPPADGGKVRKISPGFEGNPLSAEALLKAMSEQEIRKVYVLTKHYLEYCLANWPSTKISAILTFRLSWSKGRSRSSTRNGFK